ncbi:MAG: PrsW family glutamic-type intramembrane protease [Minisyncoccia bacterium]|jgi:RsiW-degrading membrane proteinase PrsW (M82 family)
MPLLVIALVFGLLPGFAWLIFYLSEDPHPEPKRLIVLAFFAGVAFGFFAIALEQMFNHAATGWGIAELSIFSLLVFALIEELMKFGAAYFAVGKSPILNDPLDRMIYLIVAALGFATLENIGAISNLPAAFSGTAFISSVFQMDSLRFVGATLLHSLTSGIVGYHWALGVARKKIALNLSLGLVYATVLHAIFNYLILTYGNISYTVLFLLVVGFFVLSDFEELKVQPA